MKLMSTKNFKHVKFNQSNVLFSYLKSISKNVNAV